MSDLNLGPAQESSPVKSILIAVAVLVVVAAAVFYLNPRKTAELSVSKVQLYAARTVSQGDRGGVHKVGQAIETENDLYIATTVHLENKLRLPIFIVSADATCTAPDGSILETKALSPNDVDRIEETFPAVSPMMANPLSFDPPVAPGSTADGAVLLHFSGLTEQAWKARKSATLTINLAHQNPQTIAIP